MTGLVHSCAVGLLAVAVLSSSSIIRNNKDPVSPFLKYIATVDGKSYFADKTELRNWASSSDYCESFGMRLVTIQTSAQWNILDQAYSKDFKDCKPFIGHQLEIHKIFYNLDGMRLGVELSSSFLKFRLSGLSYQTCVVYGSSEGTNSSWMFQRECFYPGGALCETPPLKKITY